MQRAVRMSKLGLVCTIILLVFSMLAAACGSNSSNNNNSSGASNNTAKNDSAAADSSNTDTSGNAAATDNSGGTAANTTADLPEVKLTWYFPGNWPQPEQDKVFAEVNKVVKSKINATIDFKAIPFGDYDQKMQVVIASGEPYDITFTAGWINNYTQNVAKGAFLPLDDLLAKYAPQSYASMPASFWDATKIKGQIYGFVNQQISARTPAVAVPKSLIDKYALDMNAIGGKIGPDTLNLLEPFIQAVKKDNPQKYPVIGIDPDFFNVEAIVGINVPGVVAFNDDSLTVVNQFESDGFKKFLATMRDWNAKGYLNAKERLSKKSDDWVDGKAGKFIFNIGGAFKPGGANLSSALGGEPYVEVPAGTAHLTTGGITATMMAINRNSKNPERAMMLLELLNTDKDLYNLLNFGIKDDHYKIDSDGLMIPGDNQQGYNPQVPWMFASNFLANVEKGMPADVWEQTKKVNADALPSKLLGFTFDAEPVKGEIAKATAVWDEYSRAINLGVTSEEKYNEFLSKLKSAGAEKIIAEMQKQINDWKAGN
ncbi:putative aldouronate transport system substrate-binding protein [Paenibacillus taihuensis]|uniref:Putative aldouronate transport system substrate-binding protein n=1 Tax=Paenibacillus taihuensis TaxID=1156355 RepID=A0A3D9QTK1_9BACL|nr:ABC transporter substrate-binding protein [Paenibacillus taihuensis]REE66689.1 putative aldouronate transport system substrate-binding protein [Paenibacillus taihuensis]